MKKYCPECGTGTEYSTRPPENCGKCKASFSVPVSDTPPPKPRKEQSRASRRRVVEDDYLEDEDDIRRNYDTEPLNFELVGTESSTVKLKDVAHTGATGVSRPRPKNAKAKKLTDQQYWQENMNKIGAKASVDISGPDDK